MIITSKIVRNEGKEQTHNHKNGNVFYTVKDAANYIHYLIRPKGEDNEVISAETRVKHLYSSLNITMPETLLNDVNYNSKSLEIAYDLAERLYAEHERRFKLMKVHGNSEAREIPFLQEIIFGFVDGEFKSRKNETEMADFMMDIGKEFSQQYTGYDLDIHGGFLKPHIKKDIKSKTQYLPDMHLLQMTIDILGNPLSLDHDTIKDKIGDIHYNIEQMPKYSDLLKVRTNARARNNGGLKREIKVDIAEKLREILDFSKYDIDIIRDNLKEYGITIIPEHKGNQIKGFDIRYLDKKFNNNGLEDVPGLKGDVFKYLKLADLKKSNPQLKAAHFQGIEKILLDNKGKDIETVAEELRKLGIVLAPNISKNHKISGYSFKIKGIKNNIQGSLLNFKASNYVVNSFSGDKLVMAANVYLSSTEKQENAMLATPVQNFTEDGITYVRDAFGNFKPINRQQKRFIYVHWSATHEESIGDFIRRMQEKNQFSPLLKLIQDTNNKNIFLSSYNRRKTMEIINEDRIRVFQPRNKYAVESAIDAYLSTHQLTEQEKAEGNVLTISITTDTQQSYDIMWLEARKKGIYVVNGEPSLSVKKEYDQICEAKAMICRDSNKKRILKLKSNIDNKSKYRNLSLTHYKRLGNDVDRKAYAYAFVDAFIGGLDTKYILSPPKLKSLSTARMTVDDIAIYKEVMIETIKKEAPEKMEEFLFELTKYTKVGSGGGEYKEELKPTEQKPKQDIKPATVEQTNDIKRKSKPKV